MNDPLEESKKLWREHPEMPGYCTINMNGVSITPSVEELATSIREEFGECNIVNAYANGCPILDSDLTV